MKALPRKTAPTSEAPDLLAALELVLKRDAEAGEMIFSANDYSLIDAAIKKATNG